MSSTDGFPKTIKKKINKTAEARSGNGIYKRRNSRAYRVIMHLSTYNKLSENELKKYNNGYAVRIKPSEYFGSKSKKRKDLPDSLILGKNAFIYYKRIRDFSNFPPLKKWDEIVELGTPTINPDLKQQWIGEYALFINNASPPQVSTICKSKNPDSVIDALKQKYKYGELPKQAGLGNYDYDYATKKEIEHAKYQMAYLIWKVAGMREHIITLCKESHSYDDRDHDFDRKTILEMNKGNLGKYIDSCIKHVTDYCKKNSLLDFNKLQKIRSFNKKMDSPICPLCLKTLPPNLFFETATQEEGREEEDNTQAEIVLMHIESLKPGKFNHKTYNLGWGHKHCNTIQANYDIDKISKKLSEIVENSKNL